MLEQSTLVHDCTAMLRHRPRVLTAGSLNPEMKGITFIVSVEPRSNRSFIFDVIETHGATWYDSFIGILCLFFECFFDLFS